MTSSAQVTEASAASMFAASFRVMTVTVSFGTGGKCTPPVAPGLQARRRASGWVEGPTLKGGPHGGTGCEALPNRRDLNRLEVDQRLVVGDGRAELVLLGAGEVALGLEQLGRGREADSEALVLGVESLLRELARVAGRFDALQVGVDVARGFTHRGRDRHLQVGQLRVFLAALDLRLRERRLRRAGAERIRHVHRDAPGAEVVAEDVAQHAAEAADRLADRGRRRPAGDRRVVVLVLRAAEAGDAIPRRQIHSGKLLVLRVLQGGVRAVHLLL